jgi:DNA modification methylase
MVFQKERPAPFPEELPHRLIHLYTFKGDVVLDPFIGSGTTCPSAIKDKGSYVDYDVDPFSLFPFRLAQ